MCGSPKTNDPDGVIVGCCEVLEGGVKKPGAPEFTPVIENIGDPIGQGFELVLEDTGEILSVAGFQIAIKGKYVKIEY